MGQARKMISHQLGIDTKLINWKKWDGQDREIITTCTHREHRPSWEYIKDIRITEAPFGEIPMVRCQSYYFYFETPHQFIQVTIFLGRCRCGCVYGFIGPKVRLARDGNGRVYEC